MSTACFRPLPFMNYEDPKSMWQSFLVVDRLGGTVCLEGDLLNCGTARAMMMIGIQVDGTITFRFGMWRWK